MSTKSSRRRARRRMNQALRKLYITYAHGCAKPGIELIQEARHARAKLLAERESAESHSAAQAAFASYGAAAFVKPHLA